MHGRCADTIRGNRAAVHVEQRLRECFDRLPTRLLTVFGELQVLSGGMNDWASPPKTFSSISRRTSPDGVLAKSRLSRVTASNKFRAMCSLPGSVAIDMVSSMFESCRETASASAGRGLGSTNERSGLATSASRHNRVLCATLVWRIVRRIALLRLYRLPANWQPTVESWLRGPQPDITTSIGRNRASVVASRRVSVNCGFLPRAIDEAR